MKPHIDRAHLMELWLTITHFFSFSNQSWPVSSPLPVCLPQSYKQEDSVWEPSVGGAASKNPGAAAAAAAAASRRWAVYSRFVSCPGTAPFLSFFMSVSVMSFLFVQCCTRIGPDCYSLFHDLTSQKCDNLDSLKQSWPKPRWRLWCLGF